MTLLHAATLRLLATITGAVLAALGVWLVGAYLLGVLDVLGEADRSWIFWGLALVAIGIPAITAGKRLILWGRRRED